MRLVLLIKRALSAWRIACLEAAYNADREEFYDLAGRLSAYRACIAREKQKFAELGGYEPSECQVRPIR